jgi:hypothetical protein
MKHNYKSHSEIPTDLAEYALMVSGAVMLEHLLIEDINSLLNEVDQFLSRRTVWPFVDSGLDL